MKKDIVKESIAMLFKGDEEDNVVKSVGKEGMKRTLIFAFTLIFMGLFYVYNDVDYDLQIKHYNKTRDTLIDRRYIYISDQKELNMAGMRSSVNAKLRERNSQVKEPNKKQIIIRDEKE